MATTADEGYYYTIRGGPNYSEHIDHPVPIAEDDDDRADAWSTVEDALNAWMERHRSGNTYFPLWGDGLTLFSPGDPSLEDTIIFYGDESQSIDGYTLREALQETGRSDEFQEFHGMTEYIVTVSTLKFWAEDEDHAKEQYLNAVHLTPDEGYEQDDIDFAVVEV